MPGPLGANQLNIEDCAESVVSAVVTAPADERVGAAMAEIAKHATWMIGRFQRIRQLESEANRAAASASHANSYNGRRGATARAEAKRDQVRVIEIELGLRK